MADRRITGHTAITASQVDNANDVFEIIDVSDTTDAASGTNKKILPYQAYSAMVKPRIIQSATRRHGATRRVEALSTSSATINVLRGMYMPLNEYCLIDTIGFEVTTGTTGAMWVAIYGVNTATGEPTDLIGWSGEISITGTGVKEGWNLVASSNLLSPGTYYVCWLTNTANTVRAINTFLEYFAGYPSTYGASQAIGWTVNLTYQSTPPNPYPAGGGLVNSLSQVFIGCRLNPI